MVRLGNILERLNEIEVKTVRKPTHLAVSKEVSKDLVSQYNVIASSDADLVFQLGELDYDIDDVSSFLGVNICISKMPLNEFKILEELTSDS